MNKVDIVVPVWNQSKVTVECFKSIKKYTKNYNLVWVDNGSEPKERDIIFNEIKNHENYKTIFLDKNYGFVKAVNEGLKNGKSKYVVLLNNDTAVIPNWIERLKIPFEKDDKVMMSGPFTDTTGSWQGWKNVRDKKCLKKGVPNLDNLNDHQISKELLKFYGNEYHEISSMIAFFCTLFRRELFDKIGYLDERFNKGFGDDDAVCYKTRQADYKIAFVPSTFCHHYHRTSFKALFKNDQQKLKEYQNKQINLFLNLRDNKQL